MAVKLYPKNHTSALDLELFRSPTAEYRGAPFWAWNCRLDRQQLLRQIDNFKAMGLGGFHIHARTGLATEYLGGEFMELVRACVEKAQQEGMLAWLYDEDRWPSGFAGGLVTQEPQYRARHLRFTCAPDSSTGTLLGRYHVVLREGYLARYRRLVENEAPPADGTIWSAFLEPASTNSWFNYQTYVDTLSQEAIERFAAVTHDRYARSVGQYFGGVIPAIFTDEPQFTRPVLLRDPEATHDLILPWTGDFADSYRRTFSQNVVDFLPELFWELPDGRVSVARYRYYDHVSERFAHAFAGTLGRWCEAHGIALTGHMMEEPTLQSQTFAVGEAMRSYRSFGLPGIDLLCDWREYNTAKQAQSAAHQFGRPGVLSELYGVTNWDFDFAGHKAQGDWQAALGVTVRVHHLTWVSMAGEAKRDYPASIGYQSPWWREYHLVEDHFARLNTVLTRGRARVRVGVIHPIESLWLCCGPQSQTRIDREDRERAFANLTRWLLFGLIDFDFIAESLLPDLCPEEADVPLQVGAAQYDVVIVPGLRTVRATTVERLERFRQAGGEVIFAGEIPVLVDAQPSDRARRLAENCLCVEFSRRPILQALEPFREVDARSADDHPASLLHQMRVDGERRYLFLCNTDKAQPRHNTLIVIKGAWRATVLDTMNGSTYAPASHLRDGQTVMDWDFPAHGSLLLALDPGWSEGGLQPVAQTWLESARLPDPVPITLSEPNVLLLDMASYRLNDEAWQPAEEVLRVDNLIRQRMGLPPRAGNVAQPWTETDDTPPTDIVSLRFTVHSAVAVPESSIAVEDAARVEIELDGQRVPSDVTGWFVDEAIQTVRLPPFNAGDHEIVLTMPFGRKTNLEWCYLLGDFGVEVRGRHTRLVEHVRTLAFGDWTRQGLPFYAGNITYHCSFEGRGVEMAVKAAKFRSPLLSVALDGREMGKIAFAPFQLELGLVPEGQHRLDVTAYGNRVNTFGCLHNANEKTVWFGPNAWRTTGDEWAYEYQLKPMGLLAAPRLAVRQ